MSAIIHEKLSRLITETQKENFRLLANYLDEKVVQDHFEMGDFFNSEELDEDNPDYTMDMDNFVKEQRRKGNECGTAACACGWSPFVKGIDFGEISHEIGVVKFNKNKKVLTVNIGVDYNLIAEHAFTNDDSSIFEFCFGGWWSRIDNTPKGAAKRIRYMLENGVPEINDAYPESLSQYGSDYIYGVTVPWDIKEFFEKIIHKD